MNHLRLLDRNYIIFWKQVLWSSCPVTTLLLLISVSWELVLLFRAPVFLDGTSDWGGWQARREPESPYTYTVARVKVDRGCLFQGWLIHQGLRFFPTPCSAILVGVAFQFPSWYKMALSVPGILFGMAKSKSRKEPSPMMSELLGGWKSFLEIAYLRSWPHVHT